MADGEGTRPAGASGPAGNGADDRPELEAFLKASGRAESPAPRAAFRAALREGFVAGTLPDKAPESASLEGLSGRTAGELIEGLLQKAPQPGSARAGFREELRQGFVAGSLEPSGRLEGLPEEDPQADRTPWAPPARRPRPLLRLVTGGLAAAAALWAIGVWLVPDERRWSLLDIGGEGPVAIDGEDHDPVDPSRMGALFGEAEVFAAGRRRLELAWGDDLVLQAQPGAELRLVSQGDDGLLVDLLDGEIYLKSREPYTGPQVQVQTADMLMTMSGTVVGVLREAKLTCVCVARGEVAIENRFDGLDGVCVADHRHVAHSARPADYQSFEELGGGGGHVHDLQGFAKEVCSLGF